MIMKFGKVIGSHGGASLERREECQIIFEE